MIAARDRRKTPPLGPRQRGLLWSMYRADERHSSWYEGCGWVWITASHTTEILESLHRRGLVEKTTTHISPRHYSVGREHDRITYTLSDRGRMVGDWISRAREERRA